MIKFQYLPVLLMASGIMLGCSNDDDCTKTIIVQYEHTVYTPNGPLQYPQQTQEIPCDAPEPEISGPIQEVPPMENFSYDIVSFIFTPDTGNNTFRLQFEIDLHNNNNFVAKGVPVLTIVMDGLETSGSYSSHASSPCYEIQANSTCRLTYDVESSLDRGIIDSIELISVKYMQSNR